MQLVPTTLTLSILLSLTACTQGSYEGRLINGLTNEPLADQRVLLQGETDDYTCKVKEGVADANGVFKVEGTCSGVTYDVTIGAEAWFVDGATAPHTGGEASTGPVDVKVWMGPGGEAVYLLDNEFGFKSLKTYADVAKELITGTETKILYPEGQPSKEADWKRVPDGGWVMITGQSRIDSVQFIPTVRNDPFPLGEEGRALTGPWHYIGATVVPAEKKGDPPTVTPLTATLDPAKVIEANDGGERKVRYIAADALPAGKYAVMAESDRRTALLRFGPAPAEPAAAAEEGK